MKTSSASAGMLLTATAGLNAGSADAHHSWSAEYDLSRSAYITGTVTRVALSNPHSELVILVDAADGRQERWTVFWGSPQRLRDRGVTSRTLRTGETLRITGNPHRDAKVKSLRAVSVRRGDGTEIGSNDRPGG